MSKLLSITALLFMFQVGNTSLPTHAVQVWQPLYNNQTGFTFAHSPIPGTLAVYRNGLRLAPGIDYNYTQSSANTINFTNSPADLADIGDVWIFDYEY